MGKKLKVVVAAITMLIILGMGGIVYFLSLPGELPEKIDGIEDIRAGKIKKNNMLDDMELAMDSKESIVFTEEQINHYLAKNVKLTQGGKLASNIDIKGVWVTLEADLVTFYLEREVSWGGEGEAVKSQSHITKYGIEILTEETDRGALTIVAKPLGGKIGGMPTPGLFAKLAQVPIDKLFEVMEKEKKLFSKLARVIVKDGSIELSAKANVIIKKR